MSKHNFVPPTLLFIVGPGCVAFLLGGSPLHAVAVGALTCVGCYFLTTALEHFVGLWSMSTAGMLMYVVTILSAAACVWLYAAGVMS